MEKYEKVFVGLVEIRSSQIIGVFRHRIDNVSDDRDTVATQFLARHYADNASLPEFLLLAENIDDNALHAFLSEKGIAVQLPQIGPKKELLDFAKNQVREYAYKQEMEHLENRMLTRTHMENVLTRIGYPVPKK